MAKEKVEQLLQALAGLGEFSSSPYINALKPCLSLNDTGIFNDAPNTIYDEAPGGDDRVLQRFKVQTIVLGLSRSSGCSFDHTVNADGIESKIDATASSIAHTMYRDYLENAVAASGHDKPSLLALEKDRDFCAAFADYVLDPEFITRTLIYRFLTSSSAYPQAVAYVYERVRSTLATTDEHVNTSKSSARNHWLPYAENHEGLLDAGKVGDFLQASLPVEWSSEDGLQGPSFPLLGQRISVQWRSSQDWVNLVNAQINTCDQEPSRTTPVGTGTHPPVPIIGAKTYGKQLQEWIQGKRWQYSDLFTGLKPNNYTPARDAASVMLFGCFVAGTQVRTVNGDVNIESLKTGDKVLTKAPGEYGTLSDERVENQIPKDDPIYVFGFNEEKPFVTAGHIFFTTAGPKAISPAIAREENPNVTISQLRVGDELYRLDETNSGTGYAKVRITSFTLCQAPNDVVYGVHFFQGSHGGARYHANGYLVAANYPEITMKRFKDRFANLPAREQKTSIAAIQSIPNSLSEVLGSVFTSFKNSFTPGHVLQPGDLQAIHKHTQKRMERNRVSVTSLVMAFALQPVAGVVAQDMPEIWLKEGAVMVNSELVHRAQVTHQHVHWSREKASGVWEHGSLQFASDGLMATGAVAVEEGGILSSPVPVAAIPLELIYSPSGTKITFSAAEKADTYIPAQDEAWLPFWSVKIEIVMSKEGLAQIKASLPQVDQVEGDPIYEAHVIPGKEVAIDIRISDGLEDSLQDALDQWKGADKPQLFKKLKLFVNMVTGLARGHYTELTPKGEDGDIHALHASISDKHQMLIEEAPKAIASSPIAHLDYGLNTNLYSISANIHIQPSPKAALLSASGTGEDSLSILNLQLLETPTDFDNHSTTQNYVMAAAGYWRGQKETKVFGDSRKANENILPITLKDQLKVENQKFLGDVYTRALFLYNLSTSTNPRYEGSFTSEQKEKLQYFWEGKAQSCISRKPEFGAVNNLAVRAAYLDQVPKLKDYINDSEDWAKMYYEAVSTNEYLTQMAMAKLGHHDLVNRVCMVLSVLDKQNRGYPAQLWKLIMDKSIMVLSYEGTPADPDGFSKFAVDFVEQLIIKIKNKDPSITEALVKDLGFDIENLQKTFNTEVARDTASAMFGSQSEIGRFFFEVIREGRELIFGKNNLKPLAKVVEKIHEEIDDKSERWLSPKTKEIMKKTLPALVKIGAIMSQGYQLFVAIRYLAGWGELSDIDRAKAILQVVESTFRLIGDLAPIIKDLGENVWSSSKVKNLLGRWNQHLGGQQGRATVPVNGEETPVLDHEGLAAVNSEAVESSLEAQVGEVTSAAQAEEKMTLWAKASKAGSMVLKSVVALSNVAVLVGLGFQIETEWGYERVGVIILDILNLSTVAAQVSVEVAEIGCAIIGVESVVLPLVGAILAIAGIIIMFIELSVEHAAPPDPAVTYIKEVTPAFVKDLALRPKTILTYKAPDTAPTTGPWKLQIGIKDETGKGFQVESFHIMVPVGNSESDLFSRPDTKDAKVPTNIQCVVSEPSRFSVKPALSPSPENHTMLFEVSAVDDTKPFGELSVTFAGTLNGVKGKANISITEIPSQQKGAKPDDSRTDRVKSMKITKQ